MRISVQITYPSTHGVYEEGVDEICRIVHENGGQVYMDGANMNAMVSQKPPLLMQIPKHRLAFSERLAIGRY